MQTLILGKQSALIFLEPQEAALARRLAGQPSSNKELRGFLRRAGLNTGGQKLYLELFENQGQCLLFVSPAEPECRLFCFRRVDDLMDAVAALQGGQEEACGPSRLYFFRSDYYLALFPPYAAGLAKLVEFGEEIRRPNDKLAFLAEHGDLLAEPDALPQMAKHFT